MQPKFLHVDHLLRHEALILSGSRCWGDIQFQHLMSFSTSRNFWISFFNHPLKKTKNMGTSWFFDSNFHSQVCYPKKSCCLPGNFTMAPCQKKMCFLFRQRRISSNYTYIYILVSPTLLIYSHEWTELNNLIHQLVNLIFCCPSWTETTSSNSPPQKNWRFIW